ncbi:MAG: sialate O-acetylesterase [Kiritimatiellaeota bacterium]|nr:sialate O-acetylesterase [Kiritimatiellota bacterium]
MTIMTGLFSNMVLQRNAKNVSEALITGEAKESGVVTATVVKGTVAVKGFAAKKVGVAKGGKFKATLTGIPVGGPYTVTLAVGAASVCAKNVLVGDVWILAGQSNMQGCGLMPKKALGVHPMVRAFYMSDVWAGAKDPIHNMWECVDEVHVQINGGRGVKPASNWGVCCGPAFGQEMFRRTGVPQGLIASAHGGTSMAQWDTTRKNEGGATLYGATIRRVRKNGGKVAGVLWYQGCSDANPDAALLYTQRMKTLVAAFRRDTGNPRLPVAIVQISRFMTSEPNAVSWNSIQHQQYRLPFVIKNLATVPAIDLTFDDIIHISGEAQYILGRRLAQAIQALRGDPKAGAPALPITPAAIRMVPGYMKGWDVDAWGDLVIEFKNVVGSLRSNGLPNGFTLTTSEGVTCAPFDTVLDGNCVRLRIGSPQKVLGSTFLHYGKGYNPVCNIHDDAGRPIPVFGPIAVDTPRALTPFVRTAQVSAFLPGARKLEQLVLPKNLETVSRTSTVDFFTFRNEIVQRGDEDNTVFTTFRIQCAEPMKLSLLLGYDGPVKAWIDGKERFHDPDGTPPAVAGKAEVPFAATAGEHAITIALGTANGNAWGIFMRLQRRDITKRQALNQDYVLPVILAP